MAIDINTKEKEEILKRKAEFYYSMNLKCHIKLKVYGHINGWIVSSFDSMDEFWMVRDERTNQLRRLFLAEVFDIEDFIEKEGGNK